MNKQIFDKGFKHGSKIWETFIPEARHLAKALEGQIPANIVVEDYVMESASAMALGAGIQRYRTLRTVKCIIAGVVIVGVVLHLTKEKA